jgi:hypothetical protein
MIRLRYSLKRRKTMATTVQRIGRLHQLRWMLAEIPLSADALASDSSEVGPIPFFLPIAMRRTVV